MPVRRPAHLTAALKKRDPRYYAEQYTVQFQVLEKIRMSPHTTDAGAKCASLFLTELCLQLYFVDHNMQFVAIATNDSIVTWKGYERETPWKNTRKI